jgi:acetyl esterase/lipase
MKKTISIFLIVLISSMGAGAQKLIDLYPAGIPDSLPNVNAEYKDEYENVYKVSHPSMYMFAPNDSNRTNAAVIICPGGGYYGLVIKFEGFKIAEYYARHGITAFVLKYRIPDSAYMKDKAFGPLEDAQQAIKTVREGAAKYRVDANKIGIMGFSAGGNLAAVASTHFKENLVANPLHTSFRPDFTILVYPVVSVTNEIGHIGSRDNLLGKNPSAKLIKYFSAELQVTTETPPALLIQTTYDKTVSVMNSIAYYEALRDKNIPVQMHLLQKGDHGFDITIPAEDWMFYCTDWLKINEFIK